MKRKMPDMSAMLIAMASVLEALTLFIQEAWMAAKAPSSAFFSQTLEQDLRVRPMVKSGPHSVLFQRRPVQMLLRSIAGLSQRDRYNLQL